MTVPESTPPPVPYVPGPVQQAEPLPPMGPPTAGLTPVSPAPPAAPQRSSRTGLIIAAAITAAVLLVGGGVAAGVMLTSGKSPFGAKTFTVHGSLVLQDPSGYSASTTCSGKAGYDDITGGAAVTISDAGGATVAVGRLEAGHVETFGCSFAFSVPNVPAGKGFYGVEVTHRGVLKYSEADISKTSLLMSLR